MEAVVEPQQADAVHDEAPPLAADGAALETAQGPAAAALRWSSRRCVSPTCLGLPDATTPCSRRAGAARRSRRTLVRIAAGPTPCRGSSPSTAARCLQRLELRSRWCWQIGSVASPNIRCAPDGSVSVVSVIVGAPRVGVMVVWSALPTAARSAVVRVVTWRSLRRTSRPLTIGSGPGSSLWSVR